MSSQVQLVQVLSASVPDVRYLTTLLRGVNFSNRATVTISKGGLTVAVEESRSLLGTAYVFKDMFEEYTYHPEPPRGDSQHSQSQRPLTSQEDNKTSFEIPLNTVIECLNIFGSSGPSANSKSKKWRKNNSNNEGGADNDDDNRTGPLDNFFSSPEKGTAMRMSYNGSGHPLELLIAENASGPTATCEIATYEAESHFELPFENEETVLRIILKSSWLRDALLELDPSCDKITITGNPAQAASRSRPARVSDKPLLRIHAAGTFGSTEMDYPNDKEVLETFECQRNVRFTYKFAHISRSFRALQNSSKTSLRIDEEGLLSFQFLMPSPTPAGGSSEAFTEFRCLPLNEDV